MRMIAKNLFATDNLYLSAYLLCKGAKFLRLEKSNVDGIKLFIFRDSQLVRIEKAKYLNRLGRVEPIAYRDALRDLRSLVKAEKMLKEALKEEGTNGEKMEAKMDRG